MKPIKYGIIFFLMFFVSYPAWANDHLGRLFFTELERKEIEQLRFTTHRTNTDNTTQLLLPEQITVNGLVIRSRGKNTAWINGKKNLHETGLPGLRIQIDNLSQGNTDIPVTIINGAKRAHVSPGQYMDTSTGKRLELYENRLQQLSIKDNRQ